MLVVAPFLFIACEKPNDELGFNQVIGSVAGLGVIEFDSVITYTQKIDSLLVATDETQVGYTGNKLVGSIIDGHFGRTEASFVSQMLLSDIDPDFGTNPNVDSVSLYLRYTGAYGDTSKIINLEVLELAGDIRPNGVVLDADSNIADSAYYSNYQPILGPSPVVLGSKSFIPRPNTNVRIENILSPPALKIPLDTNYFQQRFADVGNGNNVNFASNQAFVDYFKGIYVRATTNDGAILYFDLGLINSRLIIYFHNDEDPDAQSVTLNFSQVSDVRPVSFSIFNNDYSMASFDLSNQNTTIGENVTYVQAMGGVTTVLEIPDLQGLADSSILINQAYIEIRKERGTGLALAPPPRLEIREFTSRGPNTALRDFTTGTGGGTFVAEEVRDGYYRFNITKYVFEVVNTGQSKKLAVVPVSKSTVADRVILQGGYGTESPVRLKIYYTKP